MLQAWLLEGPRSAQVPAYTERLRREILRAQGVIAGAPAPTGPIAEELTRYDAHMSSARGLAAGPRCGRLRVVERLLLSKFAGQPVVVSSLLPEDVRQFIVDQLQALGTTSNAITIASTLRAYLRYRATCGDAAQPLLAVIATPAHWRMASLPRSLKPEEVDRLLNSFTDALTSPKRGYAVIRLALDLGLQGIEISRLQLADIDWRLGTVTLKRTKSRRLDLLPLPVVTGRALEAYRRHERPKTSDAAVFVRRWRGMNARISLLARVEQYRAERRQLGFKLRSTGHGLPSFARYVAEVGHHGPLTVDLMADWARQAKAGRSDRATLACRLKMLRPFTAWLRQFDTATEVPDEAVFGRVPGRMTPHVYREPKIVELLAAARQLGPEGGLRPAVRETLFGLVACTGRRISEALGLLDADVDLRAGVLTIRQSKFGKTRLVPLHPSAVLALEHYRAQRARHVRTTPELPLFVASHGQLRGQPVGDHQVRRVFDDLRRQLGWINRGSHGTPRIRDLRHAFAVRRPVLWHEQGEDGDE